MDATGGTRAAAHKAREPAAGSAAGGEAAFRADWSERATLGAVKAGRLASYRLR